MSNQQGNHQPYARSIQVVIAILAAASMLRADDRFGGLPRQAELVAAGYRQIQYTPREPGRVFLVDANRDDLLFVHGIDAGDTFTVVPGDNRAWINKDRVLTYDFDTRAEYRIYFLSDRNWNDRPGDLPGGMRGADRVAGGIGDLSYQARDNGRVWVYDVDRRDVVYQGDIGRNERIRVSPARNYISLRDEDSRYAFRLNPNHRHEIYYKRGGGWNDGGWGGGGWDQDRIPNDAKLVTAGTGLQKYRADASGRVYLEDSSNRKLIFVHGIDAGDEFSVSPSDNRAWINKERVLSYDFDRRAVHRIYFLSDRGGGNDRPRPLPGELENASRVARGVGDLAYTAPRHGRVWIYDASSGDIVYRGEIASGERLTIQPQRNYISLRSNDARSSYRLNPRHSHEIYFQRRGSDTDADAGEGVPKSARIMRSGRGVDLSFIADDNGTAYLYDADRRNVVVTQRLRRNERFTVSPASGEGAIDGQTVFRKTLNRRTNYTLYFDS